MKIDSVRREYLFSGLSKQHVEKNPVNQFRKWLNDAINLKTFDPTAMSVSTIGTDGFPQNRIVLLKFFDEQGFVFFTNYESEKGQSIQQNPRVGLHFYWPELERQMRISGFAEKTSGEVSDNYFYSRPPDSQIGAVVSDQSREIPSRKFLEDRFKNFQKQLKEQPPERPENWGGYLVKPVKMEFWQGRKNRLHDRIVYEKQNGTWLIKRLAP